MPGPSGSPFSRGTGNTINIQVANLPSFLGRFKQRMAGLEMRSEGLAEAIAIEVANVAKELVAVDTGETKDSIRMEDRGQKMSRVVVADRNGERPEVPIYLEIGTYKMAARPFMKPAADIVMSAGGLQREVFSMGGLLPPMSKVGKGK